VQTALSQINLKPGEGGAINASFPSPLMNTLNEALYISRATVRSRGWTDTLITEILGECDVEADNPHSRWTRMHLYRLDRVEAAEQNERWIQYQCKRTRPRRLTESVHVYTAEGVLIDRGDEDE
jgi:hypothetical protein